MKKAWTGYVFLLFLIVVWEGVSHLDLPNPALYPGASVVFKALIASLPELWLGTISSFSVLAPGYAVATLAGVALGILFGATPLLHNLLAPFVRIAAPVPPTVYVPYAIALLPTFHLSATFVVFIGAFWPIFLNAAHGVATVPQRHRDNARILELTRFEYLSRIVFPNALPHIFSGMGVALAMSFVMLTVAELFGASAGLGRFVQYYADFADYPRMVAGILYTGVVTLISLELLELLRRRALFWNK